METRNIRRKSDELKEEIKKEVANEMAAWKKTAGKNIELARQKGAEMKVKGQKYVCENPGKSISAAMAIGAAIGAVAAGLIRRKKKVSYRDETQEKW